MYVSFCLTSSSYALFFQLWILPTPSAWNEYLDYLIWLKRWSANRGLAVTTINLMHRLINWRFVEVPLPENYRLRMCQRWYWKQQKAGLDFKIHVQTEKTKYPLITLLTILVQVKICTNASYNKKACFRNKCYRYVGRESVDQRYFLPWWKTEHQPVKRFKGKKIGSVFNGSWVGRWQPVEML